MYDFYDFCECKSDADEIIDSAIDELKELIKQPIKEKLKKIAEWEETHREKEKELWEKSNSLERQAQKIEKEKEEWESEKEKKPIEFINNAIKRLCNGLQIGQKVWFLKPYFEHVTCPKCNGTAKVKVQYYNGDLVEKDCDCSAGMIIKRRYKVCEDYVDYINISIQFTENNICISTEKEYYEDPEYVYLKNNGRVEVKNIFSSQGKAENEAYKRNIREG